MFKNLKIGKKLIIAFIIAAVIASISGVASTVMMNQIDSQYSFALVNYGFVQGDIGKTLSAFCRIDGNVHDAIGYMDTDNQKAARDNFAKQIQAIPGYLDEIEPTLQTDATKAYLQSARTSWDKYVAKAQELMDAGNTTQAEIVRQVQLRLVSELDPIYIDFFNSMNSLMERKVTAGSSLSFELSSFSATGEVAGAVLVVVAMVISILLGVSISRGISRPLKACSDRIQMLAQGDLDAPVPTVKNRDEVGALADATQVITSGLSDIVTDMTYLLREMAQGNFDIHTRAESNYIGNFSPLLLALREINGKLSNTLFQINQSADQVASGSDQVSSGAQALSQGATEQASAVEELSATITEISDKVRTNATNAAEASQKVGGVADEIVASNRQMQELIAAMSEISASSGQIGQIINTIENIAFQTNILALNAAVEAARAGAAGKGFAVVADEVRSLASKSSAAAKDTTALIQGSIEAVQRGTQLADTTANSLLAVVSNAKEVTKTVDLISSDSNEQAISIGQISQGIDQISSVVQTNSATAEESAAASEELSSQAQLLKNLVSQFRLKDMAVTTASYTPTPVSRPGSTPSTSSKYF